MVSFLVPSKKLVEMLGAAAAHFQQKIIVTGQPWVTQLEAVQAVLLQFREQRELPDIIFIYGYSVAENRTARKSWVAPSEEFDSRVLYWQMLEEAVRSAGSRKQGARVLVHLMRVFDGLPWIGIYEVGERGMNPLGWTGQSALSALSTPAALPMDAAGGNAFTDLDRGEMASLGIQAMVAGEPGEVLIPIFYERTRLAAGVIRVTGLRPEAMNEGLRRRLRQAAAICARLFERE